MRFEFFIALRHLMSRERRALISIITAISILGVIVGVTALIMVIAVMDGAKADYLQKLIDQYAHIEVWGALGEIRDYPDVLKVVQQDPDVVAASPILQRYAMLKRTTGFSRSRMMQPARVYGIDPALEEKVSKIGRTDKDFVGKTAPGDGEIVLGAILAQQLGLAQEIEDPDEKKRWVFEEGAALYALTGAVAHTASSIVPKQAKLSLVGVFKSGMFEVDQNFAYTSLRTCQDMNVLEDVVDLVHARVKDPHKAEEVKRRLQRSVSAQLASPYVVRSWADLNPEFFRALKLEKVVMFVILLLVVIVAALNIIATLILVTMEKTREIGILRAMGCSRRSIARIFVLEGALISCVGTGLGVMLGLIGCYFLKYHCPVDIPEAVYGLDGVPVLVKPLTVLTIMVCSIGISLLASVIPAFQAARLNIVEALRYE